MPTAEQVNAQLTGAVKITPRASQLAEEFECSKCGKKFFWLSSNKTPRFCPFCGKRK